MIKIGEVNKPEKLVDYVLTRAQAYAIIAAYATAAEISSKRRHSLRKSLLYGSPVLPVPCESLDRKSRS